MITPNVNDKVSSIKEKENKLEKYVNKNKEIKRGE